MAPDQKDRINKQLVITEFAWSHVTRGSQGTTIEVCNSMTTHDVARVQISPSDKCKREISKFSPSDNYHACPSARKEKRKNLAAEFTQHRPTYHDLGRSLHYLIRYIDRNRYSCSLLDIAIDEEVANDSRQRERESSRRRMWREGEMDRVSDIANQTL